jgi:enoyl-CoA hydratase/carnithine racemase
MNREFIRLATETIMDRPWVLYEVQNHIAILTLNRPEKRNALSLAMLQSLNDQLARIAADLLVRVVILRADGPAFCAGHDLRELVNGGADDFTTIFGLCTSVMEAIRKLPQPVIAQVQGYATAAGCQLVATCDLAVAGADATFATPGVKIGLFCSTPAVALCRAVPAKKSLEMLFTGLEIDAHQAERDGLVNRVVPNEHLAEETLKLARQIARACPDVLALGKRAFYEQLPLDRPAAYELAQEVMVQNAQTPAAREGMQAFLEKRAPRWGS